MTSIETAILIFIITGILSYSGKKMVELVIAKSKRHKMDHEFIKEFKASLVVQTAEHSLLMKNTALLIESNISQIGASLLKQHREYMLKGSLTSIEYKTFERLFNVYSAMGANGLVVKLFEDIKNLPII